MNHFILIKIQDFKYIIKIIHVFNNITLLQVLLKILKISIHDK